MKVIREARRLVMKSYRGAKGSARNGSLARTLISDALRADPDNPALLTCLGALLSDDGEHKKAVAVLKRAVKLGSKDGNTFFNLAVATLNCGAHSQAMKYFKRAGELKKRSDTWKAYFDPQGH